MKKSDPKIKFTKSVTIGTPDKNLDDFSKQIVQEISDLFYIKFKENDQKWDENDKRWEENNQKLDRIMNTQDTILGKFENWETENTVGTEQTRVLRVDVDNHEIRLKFLENAKN